MIDIHESRPQSALMTRTQKQARPVINGAGVQHTYINTVEVEVAKRT
jgi:hypothetical protein